MSDYLLVLEIHYKLPFDRDQAESFQISGNVKPERQRDLLEEFLRSQMGAGSDNAPPNRKEEYCICITCDLSTDTFKVRHDCGNAGLMTGLVMEVLRKLRKERR